MKTNTISRGSFFTVCAVILVLTFQSKSVYSQNGQIDIDRPIIRPPSANALSLGKFGDIPISHYTGVPNINIPLQGLKYSDLSVDISLNYHGSGLKVEEEAGWTGLGWSLNAGGVITRSIRGEDDFPEYGKNQPNNINADKGKGFFKEEALPEHLLPEVDGSSGQPRYHTYQQGEYTMVSSFLNPYSQVANLQEKLRQGTVDGQADIFNFNGHTGKFIIDKKRNSTELYHIVMFSKEDLRIELVNNDLSGLQGFKVIDDTGTEYLFQQLEISRSRSGESRTGKLKYDQGQVPPVSCSSGLLRDIQYDNNGSFYFPGSYFNYTVSSWFLTKITSPAGGAIDFLYEQSPEYLRSIPTRSQRLVSSSSPPPCVEAITSFSFTINEIKCVYLKQISYGKIKAVFNASDRIDMQATDNSYAKKLDNIIYYYDGVQKNRWNFGYSYFNSGSNNPDYISKRLKLDYLQEVGQGNNNSKYFFNYTDSYSLRLPDKIRMHKIYLDTITANWRMITKFASYHTFLSMLKHPMLLLVGLERQILVTGRFMRSLSPLICLR